jgi:hypothetical protein
MRMVGTEARHELAISRRDFVRAVGGALAVAALPACELRQSRPFAVPPAATAEDAAEIARGLISARVGALFYVDRIRGLPGSDRVSGFAHWGELSTRMGIDPMRDVHRAFACGVTSSATDSVLVIEHGLTEDEARAALGRAVGGKLEPRVEFGFPSTAILLESTTAAIGLPRPGMLALVPSWAARSMNELASAGSLPNPRGSEVARFFAFDPIDSLGSPPAWPETISAAQAEISFDDRGGANILFQATSTSVEQAAKDAAVMEKTLDDLMHIELGPLRIPIFDPIHFASDGEIVRMEAHLLASDVDWILGFGR